jgi:hypothetical protein
MPEATATTSAPAASSAPASAPASSTPAVSMGQPSPAGSQTTGGKVNMQAAAEAAISGKGRQAVAEAFRAAPTPPAAPAPSNPQPEATAQPSAAADDTLGLSEKQVQALRRAQAWDPEDLRTIPTTNLKAWADKLAAKQSQADREYSQRKAAEKSGTGQPASKDAEAQPGDDSAAAPPEAPQEGQPSPASAAPFAFNEQAISQFVLKQIEPDAKESQTLVDQFGEDGVKAIRQRETRLASAVSGAVMQAVAPVLQGTMQVVQHLMDAEFESGIAALSNQPGFENVEQSPENLDALRKAALAEIRAKNDPKYRFPQAIKDVASRVFNVDPSLAARAQLVRKAQPILATSGARPSAGNPSPRPLTQAERLRRAAEAATSGKGAAGVREAMIA